MIDFLLEIGVEDFPPGILAQTAHNLSSQLEELFKTRKIFYRSIRTIYTPRRIGTIILGVSRRQKPQVVEIQGPPKKVAYDETGAPTATLKSFMKSRGLKPNEIVVKRIKKGEYVFGKKESPGELTEDILYQELPRIVQNLEFHRGMVWNETKVKFPRPIRWIVALLDRRPIRFEYAGIKADRYTMPNFHFSFKPIRLGKPREYMNFLRHGGVVVDPNERKKLILSRIKQAAGKLGGVPVFDDAMIDEINASTEYPEVVGDEFDPAYLELPGEVLQTVLKAHGNLIWIKDSNKFICVFSAKKRAIQNVKQGYKRVMQARLFDALFYYKQDLKQGLNAMREQTKGMMWLKGLGSVYDKSVRLEKFVTTFKDIPKINLNALTRAAKFCKADLCSAMVREKEFTSLQGIMGGYYAGLGGEDNLVVQIIKEHYHPIFVGDVLPKTIEGMVLSLCDKLDNVMGAFIIGNQPTGSYDPLGVRRNGYAVIHILDKLDAKLSITQLIEQLKGLYEKTVQPTPIHQFFQERLSRYLQDNGYRYDEINAVLENWTGDVADIHKRCDALKGFRDRHNFVMLIIGQKRVRNILKGIKDIKELNVNLFKEPAEKALYKKGTEVSAQLEPLYISGNYIKILKLLLSMRPEIDKFFDDVLVMCEDDELRNNRLSLVNFINTIFLRFADLSKIVIEGVKEG